MIKTKSSFWGGEFLIAVTAIMWSFSALLSKLANLNPILLVALRSFFALAVLLPVTKFKFKFNWLILIGTLSYLANNISYYFSLEFTTAGNSIVLTYTAPIFTLIWSCIYFKRKPSWIQILVLFMTFGSIIFIFSNDLGNGNIIGDVIALGAGVAFSGLFFVNSLPGSSPIHSTIYGSLISCTFVLFFLKDIPDISGLTWLWVGLMGGVQIGLSYIIFNIGMKRCSGFNASLISTLEVVFLPIWVGIFLHESIDMYTIIGGVIILLAIIINVLFESKQSKATKTQAE